MRGPPKWCLALLLVVTLAGGALRLAAASDPSEYQSRDEVAYAMIARAIVDKGTYGLYGGDAQEDPVHWPPGAPAMFALAYLLDREPSTDGRWDVPGAYPWQAAVGTATIVAAFVLGMLVAGPIAGLLGAVAVAFYPPLVSASGDLLSEPLGALLLVSALAAVVATMRRPSWRTGLPAGALLAGTVLTRADLLLVPAMALVAVAAVGWSRDRRVTGAARAAAPVLVALVCLCAPWTVFASGVAGHVVPLSSGGASNLWVGTYLPGDGSIFGSKRAMADEVRRHLPRLAGHKPNQISQVHVIDTVAARRPGLDPEAALRAESLENLRRYALGQPVAFVEMMARKVWRLWGGYTHGTYRKTRTGLRAVHLLIVGLGFAGLAAGLLVRSRELWLFAAVLLYLTALNAVLVSEARHNLTVMPLVAVAGAAGAVLAARRLRAHRASARPRDAELLDAGVPPGAEVSARRGAGKASARAR
jgi:hypothetical protein